MVIGNGLLASRFMSYKEDDRYLIFASGVSNSKMKNPEAYAREIALLTKAIQEHRDKKMVYFSTCSIYDPEEVSSPYVRHKLDIENIIQTTASQYAIFRVSNVAGKTSNPNTLLNYFFYHIKNGINFDLWINACRNIIDIDEVYRITDELLQSDIEYAAPINIASPECYPVKEIVTAIEKYLNTKSNYIEVNKGSCFDIDLSVIKPYLKMTAAANKTDCLTAILNKYF